MTRRKQNCPKRMKWEGGEGGEEDGSPGSPGSKGDDASSSAMSPGSVASHDPQDDDAMCTTPEHDLPPTSPSPLPPLNGQDAEPMTMLRDFRDGPGSRCPSRDSRGSSLPRCPSRESLCSDRGGRSVVAMPAMSPMSVALPASLGPLPPHSAAIAAYLAAGQHAHHRLLMTSPLPPGVVSSSSSPPMPPLTDMSPPPVPRIRSPLDSSDSSAVLDFSTKRGHNGNKSHHREDDGDSILNLSKPPTPTEMNVNSPLDLSCSGKKRPLEETSSMSLSLSSLSPSPHPPLRKSSRMSSDYKPVVSPWTSPVVASHFPYFAAAVAAASSLSPKSNHSSSHGEGQVWNGKMKSHEKQNSHFGGMPTPSDATKALEKMSELSKLGGDDLFRPSMNSGGGVNSSGGVSGTGRHSAWQSHWLNKGAEQAKDVLKCVWCKQSFPSLAAMTVHMKDAKHCGVNVPTPLQPPPPPPQHQPPTSSPSASHNRDSASSNHHSSMSKPNAADLNLLIKETMPLPRKLVRGQDVWLGKGAEQTRQILKCMWCGQSFRSLAEMTNHMQQTQHYTNIISQEQIISWKSSDDAKPGGPGGGSTPGGAGGGGASSHVSAVLTCKVCDQAFSSLKELSNHMVKNSHYKEHIMRSITESGGRRRQTREKRKKSLPVRKLLELERAQHELKNGDGGMLVGGGGKIMRDSSVAGRITCEKCGDKIDTSGFVDHIRQCVGGGAISSSQRNLLKNALLSINVLPPDHLTSEREGRKSVDGDPALPPSRHHRSPSLATDLTSPKDSTAPTAATAASTDQPSVLNAIEKLIEKSFDSRARHGGTSYPGVPGAPGAAPMGSSILKRLGIDESVDYTKPLVDAQTMNILRSYHHHQQHHYSRRERSGSESSSMSDRGRPESITPDRKLEPSEQRLMTSTPRTTPEKRIQTPPSAKSSIHDDSADDHVIKKEAVNEDDEEDAKPARRDVIVKKEMEDGEGDEEDRASYHSGHATRPRHEDVPLTPASVHDARGDDDPEGRASRRSSSSVGAPSPGLSPRRTPPHADTGGVPAGSPCRHSTSSPASSDRSGTPRSVNGVDKKSSLGALSSMFDSLSGGGGGAADGAAPGGRKPSSHPLAALQKLCDKTERHGGNGGGGRQGGGNGGGSGGNSAAGGSGNHNATATTTSSQGSNPGSILAFSWACNDAVMTSDSIMKCAFCDTPFISKGAYRHHLSKMHFVKDGAIPDPVALKAQHQQSNNSGGSSASTSAGKGNGANNNNGAGNNNSGASGSSGKSPQQNTNFEESPHSKFLKYTELAKQLSSKYV